MNKIYLYEVRNLGYFPINKNLRRGLVIVRYFPGDVSSDSSSVFRLLTLSACKGWKCWRACDITRGGAIFVCVSMKDQTAGRSRRFDYRDVNKCATMRGNGFLLTRLHRAGGVFVPSRPVPTGKNVTRRSAFSTPLTDPPTIRRFWEFCAP